MLRTLFLLGVLGLVVIVVVAMRAWKRAQR